MADSPAPALSLLDLQLPKAISWWPPAPGWWLLGVMLLLLTMVAFIYYRRRQRSAGRQVRAAALDELEHYYRQYRSHQRQTAGPDSPHTRDFIQRVSSLLKRVALISHDPIHVASLSGERWAEFLTQGQHETCQQQIRALLVDSYSAQPLRLDAEPLYCFARRWIRSTEALPG